MDAHAVLVKIGTMIGQHSANIGKPGFDRGKIYAVIDALRELEDWVHAQERTGTPTVFVGPHEWRIVVPSSKRAIRVFFDGLWPQDVIRERATSSLIEHMYNSKRISALTLQQAIQTVLTTDPLPTEPARVANHVYTNFAED